MRHLFFILLACVTLSTQAQEPALVGDILECKVVREFEGAEAGELYSKAMAVISKLTTTHAAMTDNVVDLADKDAAHIVLKTNVFANSRTTLFTSGNGYFDFNADIRCKDGRMQLITRVPTITIELNGIERKFSYAQAVQMREKQRKKNEDGVTVIAEKYCKDFIDSFFSMMQDDPDDDF